MKNTIEKRIVDYRVIRKTSHYNKYIKWFVETYGDNGEILSSCGYRTQKEARTKIRNHVMPIGNRMIQIQYKEQSERSDFENEG